MLIYVFFNKQKKIDIRWQVSEGKFKLLNWNIEGNSGSFAGNRIDKNTSVDVLNSFFHKKQSHPRLAVSLFFGFINIESFSVVIYGDAQNIVAVRKLHNNMGRIGVFYGIVYGFLRQSVNVYFD